MYSFIFRRQRRTEWSTTARNRYKQGDKGIFVSLKSPAILKLRERFSSETRNQLFLIQQFVNLSQIQLIYRQFVSAIRYGNKWIIFIHCYVLCSLNIIWNTTLPLPHKIGNMSLPSIFDHPRKNTMFKKMLRLNFQHISNIFQTYLYLTIEQCARNLLSACTMRSRVN